MNLGTDDYIIIGIAGFIILSVIVFSLIKWKRQRAKSKDQVNKLKKFDSGDGKEASHKVDLDQNSKANSSLFYPSSVDTKSSPLNEINNENDEKESKKAPKLYTRDQIPSGSRVISDSKPQYEEKNNFEGICIDPSKLETYEPLNLNNVKTYGKVNKNEKP